MDQFLYFTIKWIRTVKDKLKSLIERETILKIFVNYITKIFKGENCDVLLDGVD